ncbi:MFS transporter [Candidatus Omnitrophota bacterium]
MLLKRNKTDSNPSNIVRGKISYGWVVTIAGAFIIFIAGNFQSSFGVYIQPLINRFGWSRAAISACVSTRTIMSGLASPVAGILSDRYGPRIFILIGIFLVGLGYLLSPLIDNLWQLYLFLGALTGIGIAAFLIPIVATVTRWFGIKSALANGIISSGFGWAQVIVPPIATYLILQHGWEMCLIVMGIAALLLGTLAWSFIRTPPVMVKESAVQHEEGDTPEASKTQTGTEDSYTLSQALRTPTLWIMFLIVMVASSGYYMGVIHIVAAAIDTGMTPEAAAITLTLCGITNTLGRLALGGLATKIGNRTVLMLCLATEVLSLSLLARADSLYAFYIIAVIHGLGYGGVPPIIPTLTGSFFGTRALGSIIGSVNTAYMLGGAIGPFLAGYVFDVTGSYYTAFFYAAIVMIMALLLCLLLRPPRRKDLLR